MTINIDAGKIHYKELNELINEHWTGGGEKIVVTGVNGHRYIGNSLLGKGQIELHGVPGNDLAMFMDGGSIEVFSNVQDSAANTMNSGLLVIHGSAGDTLGYGLRGGEIFVRDDVGYRCAIHMKEYREQVPVMVVGGSAGCFLGEYMAGGIIILLNLDDKEESVGPYCASGMHGGTIYIRGPINTHHFKGVQILPIDENDFSVIQSYTDRFNQFFANSVPELKLDDFSKIIPEGTRPYHKMYFGI